MLLFFDLILEARVEKKGNFFVPFSDEFFDEFSDKFFWRIILKNLFDKFFWRVSLTSFFDKCLDEFFWQIFWQIFLMNFWWIFLTNFLTYNLLTIASFRIGVPSFGKLHHSLRLRISDLYLLSKGIWILPLGILQYIGTATSPTSYPR